MGGLQSWSGTCEVLPIQKVCVCVWGGGGGGGGGGQVAEVLAMLKGVGHKRFLG